MMSSYYSTPILVYGFNMGDQDCMIDYHCLEDKFPFVRRYADSVQNDILYEAIYGIECEINQETADIEICDEHRYEVRNLLDEYMNYLKEIYNKTDFLEKKKKISLCFRTVIDSNYGINKKPIMLEYSDDEETEDEETEEEI